MERASQRKTDTKDTVMKRQKRTEEMKRESGAMVVENHIGERKTVIAENLAISSSS